MVAALAACADSDAPPAQAGAPGSAQADGQLPEGHPPIASSPYTHQDSPTPAGPSAVVLETQDVTGYTYARVRSEGEEIWVAGPQGAVAVDDTISLGGAMGMTDFTSSELDRTFESILFLDAWRPAAPGGAPAATPGGGPSAAPVGQNRGEVLEVITASSYVYVRAETEDGEVWLAGPRMALQEGQSIAWSDGMAMRNFASNTLQRTFDVIYFVDAVQVIE